MSETEDKVHFVMMFLLGFLVGVLFTGVVINHQSGVYKQSESSFTMQKDECYDMCTGQAYFYDCVEACKLFAVYVDDENT